MSVLKSCTVVLGALLFSATTFAEPLTSQDGISVLCERAIDDTFAYEDDSDAAYDACVKYQKSEVTGTKADPETGLITVLSVKTTIDAPELYFLEGTVTLFRQFSVDPETGVIKKKWRATNLKIERFEYRAPMEKMLERLVSLANVSNGDAGYSKYDPATLDLKAEAANLEKFLENSEEEDACRYVSESDTQANWKSLQDQEQGTAAWSMLEQLEKRGEIVAVLSRGWVDGGDSEYCSNYDYRVFLKSGYVLDLDYSYTD